MLPHKKNTALHIVLANDHPDDCRLFKDALDVLHISCCLSVIENGTVLLSLLKERDFAPDVILWDLEVPCISNANCLQLMKKRKKLRAIPVVIFSKSDNPHNKDYCYKARSYEYFLRALTFLL